MRKYLFLIFSFFLFFSCKTTTTLTNKNYSNLYSFKNNHLQPSYVIYHLNDSITEIHYKFNGDQLLTSHNKSFQLKINATYYNSFESSLILDSTSILLSDSITKNESIVGLFTIKIFKGTKGVLRLSAFDNNAGNSNIQFILIDKESPDSRQFFLPTVKGLPTFDYLTEGENVEINFKTNTKELLVGYYNIQSPLPPPPFSLSPILPFDQNPSDIFHIETDGKITNLDTKKEGIYFISKGEQKKSGLTLYNYGKDFPKITDIEALIEPMRYITSKKEFEKLTSNKDSTRYFFEAFWLNCTSDPKKAKDLIKNYFGRIENSNILFSSYIPGWKTDRGIIYLIFGPPNIIKKTSTKESWTYGEENNYMSVNFVFTKENNFLSDNHFTLNRSSVYKTHWYRAVDNWRQGKISTK